MPSSLFLKRNIEDRTTASLSMYEFMALFQGVEKRDQDRNTLHYANSGCCFMLKSMKSLTVHTASNSSNATKSKCLPLDKVNHLVHHSFRFTVRAIRDTGQVVCLAEFLIVGKVSSWWNFRPEHVYEHKRQREDVRTYVSTNRTCNAIYGTVWGYMVRIARHLAGKNQIASMSVQ